MNIFVAGIHGVGKTYLASQVPDNFGLMHTSASKLIREELNMPNWTLDKRVSDAEVNQIALAAAVKRHNSDGKSLLLDGHFVLLDSEGEFLPLGSEVFDSLNLDGVVLIEASAQVVASRVADRDNRIADIGRLEKFIQIERFQAERVCNELGIPLIILNSPSNDEFITVISEITNS